MVKKILKHLGYSDFRPSEKQKNSKAPADSYDLAIGCIIKDENEYMEEWINYHLKTGVQHFYIYDNGSRVPVYDTLADLNLLKYATVIRVKGSGKQISAYRHCLEKFGATARWIAFIDVDEFIVAKTSGGNLVAFLKDYEQYGGLGINWLVFGSNGHLRKAGRPQLESFKLRANNDFHVNSHIKSIVQPKYVRLVGDVHYFEYITDKFCVNENFMPIAGPFSKVSVNKIQLNHYFCRSAEEFEAKIKRGRGDNSEKRTMKEFHYNDSHANELKDTAILELFE